jgi:hypothetical protein
VQHDGPSSLQLEIGGQKRITYMHLLKNKQLSYRTKLIKKKEGRKTLLSFFNFRVRLRYYLPPPPLSSSSFSYGLVSVK